METSLSKSELSNYLKHQLNNNFPDTNIIDTDKISTSITVALEKLENCLSKAVLNRFQKNGTPYFDHLFSDTYMLFLCYLANTVWQETSDRVLSSKVYYLNKIMHSFDCMYDNNLPEIFLIIHGSGTMMGKADYGNYFIVYQGCTIGASHGIYPRIGNGVSLTANSSIIGKATIGHRSTISTRTTIFQKDIPEDSTAFINFDTGQVQIKPSKKCYAQQFFNVDLNTV